ncbi:hypothetical protein LOAG_06121 [Loa loa]|uniref:Uncharacterized protein n=1 Tax=Loa loa TaxID=7209 RepID=A0A1S0U065_LOALO|nr:hypothetical protein LOAG_06121 [Loa loa]EFO22364.1 hypothetical protein LOAG_06121 [Loa loa]
MVSLEDNNGLLLMVKKRKMGYKMYDRMGRICDTHGTMMTNDHGKVEKEKIISSGKRMLYDMVNNDIRKMKRENLVRNDRKEVIEEDDSDNSCDDDDELRTITIHNHGVLSFNAIP